MARIGVGLSPCLTWAHRQHWLGPIKRLDLGFLIHRNHKGIFRGTEVETKNGSLLGFKFRVRTLSTPLVDFVRFKSSIIKNATNCRPGKTRCICEFCHSPLIAAVVGSCAGKGHNANTFIRSDNSRSAFTGNVFQALKAMFLKRLRHFRQLCQLKPVLVSISLMSMSEAAHRMT